MTLSGYFERLSDEGLWETHARWRADEFPYEPLHPLRPGIEGAAFAEPLDPRDFTFGSIWAHGPDAAQPRPVTGGRRPMTH